jgi:hypothetical protein
MRAVVVKEAGAVAEVMRVTGEAAVATPIRPKK